MCVAYPTSLSSTSPHSSGIWVPSPKVGPSSPSPSWLSLQLPLLWAAQLFPSPRLKLHAVFTSSSSAHPSPNIKSVLHNRSFALATWQCPAWPMLSFWDLTWCHRCRQALPLHSSPPNSSEHKAYQLKEQVLKFTLCLKKSQRLLILAIYYSSRKLQGEGSKANLLWLQLALEPPSALSRVYVAAKSVPTGLLCTSGLLVFSDYSASI